MREIKFLATKKVTIALLLLVLLAFNGCAPPGGQSSVVDGELPELTKEIVDERINDVRIYKVLPESGVGETIPWSFDEDEPKEIVIVEQQINGPSGSMVLDIKTQSSPRAQNLRYLSGQIRLDWRLETGWALRRWEIVNAENLTMKYKDLPKPTPTPSPDRAEK